MTVLEVLANEAFCRVAEALNSDGNHVRLLRDATETYPAWLEAIATAEHTVHLENYIIQEDSVGRDFATALIAAAGRGVRCRVLYDWMGCLARTSPRFWNGLRAAGVEVRRYSPPELKNPFGWLSRDHRKVLCVDRRIAFTGGLCIGHDWLGTPARNTAPWRDTAIEIHGPAVGQIDAAFADSWTEAGPGFPTGEDLPPAEAQPFAGGLGVSVIAGRPYSMGLYRLELLIAEVAERSLWLTDGYFVATTGYVRALTGAAQAGVDVRLLVPGSSNWPIVGALSKSAYRPLLESGVRVFEWNGPMLHAKTAVVDGCWTRIGSSNSNLASWISNRELDVTIKGERLATEMEFMFEQDMRNSTEVVLWRGRAARSQPVAAGRPNFGRQPYASASRVLSGAIGISSALGASLTQHRKVGSAESIALVVGGGLLLMLAIISIAVPRLIAYPIAVVALWLAAGLVMHAWRFRTSGRTADAGR